MLKIFLSILFLSCLLAVEAGDSMLGPGIWSLISVNECDVKPVNEVVHMEITKHKLNRTHDGLDATFKTTATVDDSYGALIDVCKFVDGGCKQYQVLTDNSMVNMINKYAKDMFTGALTMANIDPPEFPIYEDTYKFENFVMDWCTLPREAPYGKFEAIANLVKNNQILACLKLVVEFNKFEDDENFCDPEEE